MAEKCPLWLCKTNLYEASKEEKLFFNNAQICPDCHKQRKDGEVCNYVRELICMMSIKKPTDAPDVQENNKDEPRYGQPCGTVTEVDKSQCSNRHCKRSLPVPFTSNFHGPTDMPPSIMFVDPQPGLGPWFCGEESCKTIQSANTPSCEHGHSMMPMGKRVLILNYLCKACLMKDGPKSPNRSFQVNNQKDCFACGTSRGPKGENCIQWLICTAPKKDKKKCDTINSISSMRCFPMGGIGGCGRLLPQGEEGENITKLPEQVKYLMEKGMEEYKRTAWTCLKCGYDNSVGCLTCRCEAEMCSLGVKILPGSES